MNNMNGPLVVLLEFLMATKFYIKNNDGKQQMLHDDTLLNSPLKMP